MSRPLTSLSYKSLFLLGIFFLFVAVAWAGCPDCFYNLTPMNGQGPAPDGSGRRTIQIRIDASWGEPTNTAIWNGTQDARNEWNGARDAQGNSTGYYLDLNQSTSTPDIIIIRGTPLGNACAGVTGGPPYVITLRPGTSDLSAEEIRGHIAHEIGC
jgi:hypothetical protein